MRKPRKKTLAKIEYKALQPTITKRKAKAGITITPGRRKKISGKTSTAPTLKPVEVQVSRMQRTYTKSRAKISAAATPAKQRRSKLSPLYEYALNERGSRIYSKKPHEFTKAEINQLAKGVNDRLYKLEKAGLDEYSQEYQMIKKYAVDNYLNMYNLDLDTGKVRVTRDLQNFPDNEAKYDYIRVMQNIMNAKTSTIAGTKEAMGKAYESFMQRPDIVKQGVGISQDTYNDIWKAYRDKVKPNKKERLKSDVVMDFISAITDLGYNDIPSADIYKAFELFDEGSDNPYHDFYEMAPDVFSSI